MSDLTLVHPFERGWQAKGIASALLLLPVWHTGPRNENASSERNVELRWESDASPAPVLQRSATSLCLSSPPTSTAPQEQAERGDLCHCHCETQPMTLLTTTWWIPHVAKSFSLFYPPVFVYTCTQTIPLQELVKNYWTEFRFFRLWLSVFFESKSLKSIRRWVSGNQVLPDQKDLVSKSYMREGWDGEGRQINSFHYWSHTIKPNMFLHVFLQTSKQH